MFLRNLGVFKIFCKILFIILFNMHCEINAALRFRDAEHLEGLVGNALSVHRQKWDLTHARQQT
jgi:hypothetical protein